MTSAWPRWLALEFKGPKGPIKYIVHFEFLEGRWLIRDWVTPHLPTTGKQVKP